MTSRVLPVEEWPRLDTTLLASVWRTMDPRCAEVLVVECDGNIVGSVALITSRHAECLSGGSNIAVARALWIALRDRVRETGGAAVWGAAVDEPMRRLLRRHAEAIPGEHFLVRV